MVSTPKRIYGPIRLKVWGWKVCTSGCITARKCCIYGCRLSDDILFILLYERPRSALSKG